MNKINIKNTILAEREARAVALAMKDYEVKMTRYEHGDLKREPKYKTCLKKAIDLLCELTKQSYFDLIEDDQGGYAFVVTADDEALEIGYQQEPSELLEAIVEIALEDKTELSTSTKKAFKSILVGDMIHVPHDDGIVKIELTRAGRTEIGAVYAEAGLRAFAQLAIELNAQHLGVKVNLAREEFFEAYSGVKYKLVRHQCDKSIKSFIDYENALDHIFAGVEGGEAIRAQQCYFQWRHWQRKQRKISQQYFDKVTVANAKSNWSLAEKIGTQWKRWEKKMRKEGCEWLANVELRKAIIPKR